MTPLGHGVVWQEAGRAGISGRDEEESVWFVNRPTRAAVDGWCRRAEVSGWGRGGSIWVVVLQQREQRKTKWRGRAKKSGRGRGKGEDVVCLTAAGAAEDWVVRVGRDVRPGMRRNWLARQEDEGYDWCWYCYQLLRWTQREETREQTAKKKERSVLFFLRAGELSALYTPLASCLIIQTVRHATGV